MPNQVTAVPAASSQEAEAYFSSRFALETDCWDVHDALSRGCNGFCVAPMCAAPIYTGQAMSPGRSPFPMAKSPSAVCERGPTTHSLSCTAPVRIATERNGRRSASTRLGRPVKEMTGGVTGWADEGFSFAAGEEPGRVGNTP